MASLAERPQPQRGPRLEPGPDPEIGRIIKGKYKIIERLGAGGMAVVYRAEEQGLIHRDVAIKVLRPDADLSQAMLTRFLKEAQAIAAIGHSNVVHLLDIDRTEEGRIYLVMERLVGKSLQLVLKEMHEAGEVFNWERLAPLMIQACRALHAAHKQNIIHRDIKPGNCFCCNLDDDEWHIKILDFGIAKARANNGSSPESMETPLTQDGMFIGTPHYAAPEVIRQQPDQAIDGRVDIFALGVMMYQCLTGTLPFQGEHQDKFTILYRTLHERPPSPRERAPERDIPPQVDALIMRAIEAEPGKRFASVVELAESIRATLRSAADFSGMRTLPPRSAIEQTPRPPGESLAALSSSALSSSGQSLPQEATPRPQLATARMPAVALRPDQSTPKPPGEAIPTTAPPTVIQQVPPRASMAVLVALGAMSVGVLALLLLFIYESSKAQPPAPPAKEPAPKRAMQSSPPPPVESPPPAAPQSLDPPRQSNPSPEQLPKAVADPPVVETEEPENNGQIPQKRELPDFQASRRNAVKAQLKGLVDSRALDKCLPLHLGYGDGVFDELPIKLIVDSQGVAEATVSSRKVPRRLPKSSDACVLKIVQGQRFSGGEGSVVVNHSLQFD